MRWLDGAFLGQYLPSLSINYVAINKDLEKWPAQLYYMKMQICSDQSYNNIWVVIATKWPYNLFHLQPYFVLNAQTGLGGIDFVGLFVVNQGVQFVVLARLVLTTVTRPLCAGSMTILSSVFSRFGALSSVRQESSYCSVERLIAK